MYNFLSSLDSLVWGPPLLVLLVGTGIYFSSRLGLLQVFRLPKALKLIFKSEAKGKGDISSFAALATALAATVGTGILSVSQLPSNLVVQGHFFGCGWPHSLEWLQNMLKVF